MTVDTATIPARCPTCGAGLKGAPLCRRCKTDLGPLVAVAARAATHAMAAADALRAADPEAMFYHARRSVSLRQTPAGVRLLACAALLSGRLDLAVTLWRRAVPAGADHPS